MMPSADVLPVDITGRWEGHYRQREKERPIAAELAQAGSVLTGLMTDDVTSERRSVSEIALEAGLPPGEDERIVAHLRRSVPGGEGKPIEYVWELPKESALEGTVQGRTVSFLKTYKGEHTSGFQVGRKRVEVANDAHSVHYSGTLSQDGQEIRGHWSIDAPPGASRHGLSGEFVLRRAGAPATMRQVRERHDTTQT
jgi:hypothetical protein